MSIALVTSDVIAEYLGEPDDGNFDLAVIPTCVRVIGAYPPGDYKYSELLVALATGSLFQWLDDYGVLDFPEAT